jgi:hypothetical protein
MQKSGGKGRLPEVDSAASDYLALFTRVGPAHSSGMGLSPVSYSEIALAAPWADESERNLIRDMSASYLEGTSFGEDPFAMHPMSQAEALR